LLPANDPALHDDRSRGPLSKKLNGMTRLLLPDPNVTLHSSDSVLDETQWTCG
jgi:hypothetical protein